MTMRTHVLSSARRALGWAAVVITVGATACSESPAAPDTDAHSRAASSVTKPQPAKTGAKRRGGYNVVAD
jgi:hypothetical protein